MYKRQAVLIIMIVVLFGAAVAMFGGGSDSNSYTPVSAEVEAYEPVSYTHLDVYKRQALGQVLCRRFPAS